LSVTHYNNELGEVVEYEMLDPQCLAEMMPLIGYHHFCQGALIPEIEADPENLLEKVSEVLSLLLPYNYYHLLRPHGQPTHTQQHTTTYINIHKTAY